jgi:putative membrane protein
VSTESRRPGPVTEAAHPVDKEPLEPWARKDASAHHAGKVEQSASPIIEEDVITLSSPAHKKWPERPWLMTLLALLVLMIAALGWWWGSILVDIWVTLPLIAVPLVMLSVSFAWILGRAVLLEYRAARRIDRLEERQREVHSALETGDLCTLKVSLAPTLAALHKSRPALIREFEAAANGKDNVRDYANLLHNLVLTPLDEQARGLITRASLTTGAAVAISPHPGLDALVILWRASALVRDIGDVYGLAPTGLSSIRLLKHVLANAVLAAGLDLLGDVIVDEFGRGTLNATVGKAAGEAAVMSRRTYRLGKLTQSLCRPLPLRSPLPDVASVARSTT